MVARAGVDSGIEVRLVPAHTERADSCAGLRYPLKVQGVACMRLPALLLALFVAATAAAHPGRGIVVAEDGTVFVADAVRSVVWRIDAEGVVSAAARGVHAHWLAADADGRVLADHVEYESASGAFLRGLVAIDRNGRTETLVAPAAVPDGLDGGAFVASGDTIAVARDSVAEIVFRDRARIARRIAFPGRGEAPVSSMVADGHGGLWLAHGRSLSQLDADGRVLRRIEVPAGTDPPVLGLDELWGLGLDERGPVYTTDPGQRRVIAIEATDRIRTVAQLEAPWFPTGVAVRGGRIWLLEHGLDGDRNLGPRVRVGAPDGPFTVLAEVTE
jgi:hypothetical protein